MKKNKKNRFFPEQEIESEVDDIYAPQKKYLRTKKGKKAMKKARKAYDARDPERRKRQKREYMKRKRAEKRAALRSAY
tara:strand:+ start:404 stop:637 length:234 start_codon:yes stop_codon:yes gene_type:complete